MSFLFHFCRYNFRQLKLTLVKFHYQTSLVTNVSFCEYCSHNVNSYESAMTLNNFIPFIVKIISQQDNFFASKVIKLWIIFSYFLLGKSCPSEMQHTNAHPSFFIIQCIQSMKRIETYKYLKPLPTCLIA